VKQARGPALRKPSGGTHAAEPDAPQAALLHAAAALDRGDLAGAEAALSELVAGDAPDASVFELQGLLRLRQNRLQEAELWLRRALKAAPRRPMPAIRLAALLLDTDRGGEGLSLLRELAQALPSDALVRLELAQALHRLGQLDGAAAAYRRAVALDPSMSRARQGLAGVLTALGEHAQSEAVVEAALSRPCAPVERGALEMLRGGAQFRQRRWPEALASFERAQAASPTDVGVQARRASVLQAMGQVDAAIDAYGQALRRQPLDLAVHRELNDLLYRAGRDQAFLTSYDKAQVDLPGKCLLKLAKGFASLKAEHLEAAEQAFAFTLQHDPHSAQALVGLARVNAANGQMSSAIDLHVRSLAVAPEDADLHTSFAATLIRAQEGARALEAARTAVALAPTEQAALATLGLAYRACDDAGDEALNNYARFVGVFDLDPPRGYGNMEAFNADLAAYLRAIHSDKREHFDQSLRRGTRTFGELFNAGHDLVERLRERVDAALARYIKALPRADHPFLRRQRRGTRFLCSWSSRMMEGGFHADHIHPGRQAWISSCYYVTSPKTAELSAGRQGWLKFGEPSPEFGFQDDVRHAVAPTPGRLVLFPSYMWHGTYAYAEPCERMTIAFDATPV
jgi:tetratricopeptide (TPR) repeat protein